TTAAPGHTTDLQIILLRTIPGDPHGRRRPNRTRRRANRSRRVRRNGLRLRHRPGDPDHAHAHDELRDWPSEVDRRGRIPASTGTSGVAEVDAEIRATFVAAGCDG